VGLGEQAPTGTGAFPPLVIPSAAVPDPLAAADPLAARDAASAADEAVRSPDEDGRAPDADGAAGPHVTPAVATAASERPRWPGRAALVCAVIAVAALVAALALVAGREFGGATLVAWAAIAASVAAILGGLLAILGRWGRGPGIAALVLGVLANPYLLLKLFELVGGP